MSLLIFTIGHSTRKIGEFIEILKEYCIEQVIDVRTIPFSRHNPQFNEYNLADVLRKAGIGYVHMKELGGLRQAKKDSVNMGWKNSSFRGYADYMQTKDFEKGLKRLISLAKKRTSVMMCAEALPWRCHRSLIADALIVRKIKVAHIMSRTGQEAHKLTDFANVKGKRITYPKK